jgi:hypothetical protein
MATFLLYFVAPSVAVLRGHTNICEERLLVYRNLTGEKTYLVSRVGRVYLLKDGIVYLINRGGLLITYRFLIQKGAVALVELNGQGKASTRAVLDDNHKVVIFSRSDCGETSVTLP